MKTTTLVLATIAVASLSAQAQTRALNDVSPEKAAISFPINVECGAAFAHPDGSVDLQTVNHHVKLFGDRVTGRVTVTVDGEQWSGIVDKSNGNFHITDPHGVETVRAPLPADEVRLIAAQTRAQFLAAISPCSPPVLNAPKCLNNNGFRTPAPGGGDGTGPFGPVGVPKGCFPDYYGDEGYWSVQLYPDFQGADSIVWDPQTPQQMCQQQKASCMQACGDSNNLAQVSCGALAIANAAVGLACEAGALYLYSQCESHCNAAFPC